MPKCDTALSTYNNDYLLRRTFFRVKVKVSRYMRGLVVGATSWTLYARQKRDSTRCTRGYVVLGASMDESKESPKGIKPSTLEPIAICYTDYAIRLPASS